MSVGRRGDRGYLMVRDEGAGISETERERIFERYFRPDITRAVEGFGLGLYVTREIVARHGGELLLESAPGQGATFTALLPLSPEVPPRT